MLVPGTLLVAAVWQRIFFPPWVSNTLSFAFKNPTQLGSPECLEGRKPDHPAKEVCGENNPKQTEGIILKNLEGQNMETTNKGYLYLLVVFSAEAPG